MSEALATSNACFNGLSAILLSCGYVAIRRGNRKVHPRLMLAALGSSTLFLAGYLTRLLTYGTTRYEGAGRSVYLAILASHTLLAASLVVLVPLTLWRAKKSRFAGHKRIARVTLPIWLYVSVTGVVIYFFLYR